MIDEQNNVYVGFVPRSPLNPVWLPAQLISSTSAGAERWRVSLSPGIEVPLAVFRGEVMLNHGEVRSTLDGTKLVDAPGGTLLRTPLMGSNSRTVLVDPPSTCCPTCPCPQALPRVDAMRVQSGSATLDWQTNIASGIWDAVSDPVATRQGDLLIAGDSMGSAARLIALGSSGTPRFSCEIPPTVLPGGATSSRFTSPVALIAGRWAVVEELECHTCVVNPNPRLRVFNVPGERPTLHGWVGAHGSASGSSRPLP